MYTDKLFGKEFLDIDANRIGKIVDIDVELLTGSVDHLLVKAGLTTKYKISPGEIDKIGDRLILKIRADQLKK